MSNVAQRAAPMTVEEFLDFCDRLPEGERWELHDGAPQMMTGGTLAHARIVGNVLRSMDARARQRGCEAVTGFLIRSTQASLFEPDVTVLCGASDPQVRYSDRPAVVVEVLSPSTMRIDRIVKFEHYRAMPSVEQIVHVFQENVRVEGWFRRHGAWMDEPAILVALDQALAVPSLGGSLPLSEVYAGLDHLGGA